MTPWFGRECRQPLQAFLGTDPEAMTTDAMADVDIYIYIYVYIIFAWSLHDLLNMGP